MFKATTVPGVSDAIPEKYQGVFWMKGNGVAEELAVMHYSLYDQASRIMLVPIAPFQWAWADGKPLNAPYNGNLYTRKLIESAVGVMLKELGRKSVSKAPTVACHHVLASMNK